MHSQTLRWAIAVGLLAAAIPIRQAGAHPDFERSYTITSVLQVLQPVNPADMTDDSQDCKVLAHDNDSYTLQVTYYPLYQQPVGEDANWRTDDAGMIENLNPTPDENWDPQMRRDLLAQLRDAGIEPDRLTDKQLVQAVSAWAMRRSRSTDEFKIWMCCFNDGKPAIFPGLIDAFQSQSAPGWTPRQTFDEELLGKSMFYAKVHGSCTSSAIYMSTILRALGVPTRIIFCIPPFDPNDNAQAGMFFSAVHHNQVRETVRAALDGVRGFDNHLFNEVFVGHHWVRLNYNTLGQPILAPHYFGLLTHIYTTSDLSETPLAQTWGMRYFHYPADQPPLSSINPYRLTSVADHFGSDAQVDNPPVPIAELRTVTIDRVIPGNSPELPDFFRTVAKQYSFDLFIAFRERVDAVHATGEFYKKAGHDFLLSAPNVPAIRVAWVGGGVSTGDLWTCPARIEAEDKPRIVPGVAYSITPTNVSDVYRWVVAPGVSVVFPKNEPGVGAGGNDLPTSLPMPGTPLEFGKQITIDVRSSDVWYRGNKVNLVALGRIHFDLDRQTGHLRAAMVGSTLSFDQVCYDISVAVFDGNGALLGTARSPCQVQRLWLGINELAAVTIPLDFGVSLNYPNARSFMVSISERKVLTPDQWQK